MGKGKLINLMASSQLSSGTLAAKPAIVLSLPTYPRYVVQVPHVFPARPS
jgi:hypothetical protein